MTHALWVLHPSEVLLMQMRVGYLRINSTIKQKQDGTHAHAHVRVRMQHEHERPVSGACA